MPTPLRHLIALLAGLTVLASATGAAPASPTTTAQRLVDAYLATHPGGQQTSATDIAYRGGAYVVTLTRPAGILAGPDCPAGWFCFYDYSNYGYPRGKLSDCGWQDLGWWGWRNRTDSVHYNLSFGSVTFINETGATDTALFTVSTTRRAIADVSPNRNRADYVYRSCT